MALPLFLLLISIFLFISGIIKDNKILKIVSIFLFFISILFFVSVIFFLSGANQPNSKQMINTKTDTNQKIKTGQKNNPIEGIDFITTENYANKKLNFYYYIPYSSSQDIKGIETLLILVPGLSGNGENFITSEFKKFAGESKLVIISPSFKWDEKNWSSQTSYQYPSAWSGQALENIIHKIEEGYNLNLSKYYLFGFSAGAQFALRFCLLKPELCTACASHGSGGTILPSEKINAKFFVTVGSTDYSRINNSKIFCEVAKKYGVSVIYKEYDGGHSLSKAQISDSINFFMNIK